MGFTAQAQIPYSIQVLFYYLQLTLRDIFSIVHNQKIRSFYKEDIGSNGLLFMAFTEAINDSSDHSKDILKQEVCGRYFGGTIF